MKKVFPGFRPLLDFFVWLLEMWPFIIILVAPHTGLPQAIQKTEKN